MDKKYYLAAVISLCFLILIAGGFAIKNILQNDKINVDKPDSKNLGQCIVGGCSGQLCLEKGDDTVSTCEYTASYACYKSAKCEKQSNGKCGWTQTDELKMCLSKAK